jgi:hypothetical protein
MKLYKSLFIVAAIICGMMTSCKEDGYWDKASSESLGLTNGSAYSFNSKSLSFTYTPTDVTKGTDINVTVTRSTTSGAATLPIAATFSDEGILSAPESVTFEDGSNTTNYVIHFEKEIEIGQSVSANLVIDTLSVGIPKVEKPTPLTPEATAADSAKFLADSTNYAIYLTKLGAYKLATKVTIAKDYNWISLGKATYRDDYITGLYSVDNVVYEVEIREAQEAPGYYRLVNAYGKVYEYNKEGDYDDTKEYFVNIHAEDPTAVYITQSDTGCDWGKGNFILYSMAGLRIDRGQMTLEEAKANGLTGKLEKGMITFPTKTLLLARGEDGWYYANTNGKFLVALPGVKVADYTSTLDYAGMFTDPANVVYVLADYKLSADAKAANSVKVAIVNQSDDAEAVADAIAAGEFEATDVADVAKDDRIQLALPEDMQGKLQMLLVVIDKNDAGENEVKFVASAKFEYYSGANPWKSLGKGLYTDDLVYPLFTKGNPSTTYEVEIEEHSETPGLYRLVDPYGEAFEYYPYAVQYNSTSIVVHAEDPDAVYIPEQTTGLTLTSDGEISILTVGADYYAYYGPDYYEALKQAGYFGTLKNGVMTFPSFDKKDQESGEVLYTYQGYVTFSDSESYYNMGTNGEMKIVLPSAVTPSARRAARFETNLKKYTRKANASYKDARHQVKFDKRFIRQVSKPAKFVK